MKLLVVFLICWLMPIANLFAQSFDTFSWALTVPNCMSPAFLRCGNDDSVYVGGRIYLHVYSGNTISYYALNNIAGIQLTSIAFEDSSTWIGTDSGLVKKAGAQFQEFNESNCGINSNYIYSLFFDGSQLLIGTDSGMTIKNGNVWINISQSDLGITDVIKAIGKNSFGMYAVTVSGKMIFNSGQGWRPIINSGYQFLQSKRLVNSDSATIVLPADGAYIRDSVLQFVNFPTDPCLFKDAFIDNYSLIINESSNENFILCGQSQLKFLLKSTSNFQPDLSSIKHLLNDPFSVQLKNNSNSNLYDFDNNGKLFWIQLNQARKIFSVYFALDSFAVELPFDECPYLDINEVRARIRNNGSLFWDLIGVPSYEVPKGSGLMPIFGSGFWIGGLDSNQQIHLAAQTYRQGGSDFWPGPLDTLNATIDLATTNRYDSVWKIDKSAIDNFIYEYSIGNVQNGTYQIPREILNWPAVGSANYSRSLAPFFDRNQDGNYTPIDGDYPLIKGSQMIWWVFNDNYSQHAESNSSRNLGVEIHGSAYAYNCNTALNSDSVINYTTFYHYDVINRSDTNYHNVYIGIFTDVDLGFYGDDFVGCDSVNDFGFGYNGDNDDDEYPYNKLKLGYGLNPPMINNLILKGPEAEAFDGLDNNHNGAIDELGENCMMNSFNYFDNSSTITGNPINLTDYYFRLQSQWGDGTFVTAGGNGYNAGSQNYSHYMFNAIPYSGLPWSEMEPGLGAIPNIPGDRRFLISSGPFNLNAHQLKSIDLAYVYTRDPRLPNGFTTSITTNRDEVLKIKQFFDSNNFPCDNLISVNEIEDLQMSLYPNPADGFIEFNLSDNKISKINMIVRNVLGGIVFSKELSANGIFKINTENFANGIYILTLISGEKITTKKFVIQHRN